MSNSEDDSLAYNSTTIRDVSKMVTKPEGSDMCDKKPSFSNKQTSVKIKHPKDKNEFPFYSTSFSTPFNLDQVYGGTNCSDDSQSSIKNGQDSGHRGSNFSNRASTYFDEHEESSSDSGTASSSDNEFDEICRHIQLIRDWTKEIKNTEVISPSQPPLNDRFARLFSSKTVGTDDPGLSRKIFRSFIERLFSSTIVGTDNPGSSRKTFGSLIDINEELRIPDDVVVDEEIMDSLKLLSDYLIEVRKNHRLVETVVEDVANIPNLMMYIILIGDDEDREKIMKYPIIKRVMLCKYSITMISESSTTSWISYLLQTRKSSIQERVVDYLLRVSDITAADVNEYDDKTKRTKDAKKILKQDETRLKRHRDDLVETLRNETHLMPSLLLLKSKDLERVSKTSVIKTALDLCLCHPFGIAIVFFDIFAHAILLFSIRYQVFYFMDNEETQRNMTIPEFTLAGEYWRRAVVLTFAGLMALAYLLFRRITNEVFMCSLCWKVWLVHFLQLSFLIDIVSMILSIVSFHLWIQHLQSKKIIDEQSMNIIAINIGFLWMSLINQLKIINANIATFVYSIGGIVKSIVVFLVIVVGTVIWAFGDVLYIILKSNDEACPMSITTGGDRTSELLEERFAKPFCLSLNQSYLAVYRVFIGDLDVDDFEGSKLTMLVFVLLTFFAVIILLNVLIALVIKSHEASQLRAQELFGSARVQYVAQIIGIEIFLHPLTEKYGTKGWRMAIKTVTYCSGAMALISSILSGIFLVSCFQARGINEPISKFLACCIITFADMIFLALFSFVYTGWRETGGIYKYREATRIRKLQNNAFMKNFIAVPATFMARFLMGMSQVKIKKDEQDSLRSTFNDKASILLERRMQKQVSFLRRRISHTERVVHKSKGKIEKKELVIEQQNDKETNEIKNLATKQDMMTNDMKDIRDEMKIIKKDIHMMEQNIIESLLKLIAYEKSDNTISFRC